MTQSKHIIVVGCGRLGGLLATRLSHSGHKIMVIDKREVAFDKLSADFSGFKFVGDVTEPSILRQAEIENADYVFAVTTLDNTNLMVAQVARHIFNVPHVVARVFDPLREAVYCDFGIQTISPTKLALTQCMDCVS